MSTSQYGNYSLCGDHASSWNKFFKDFFTNHDFTTNFLQTYENGLKISDTGSNNFFSIFSPDHSFIKCSPATQLSN